MNALAVPFTAIREALTPTVEEIDEMIERDVCMLHDAVFMELKTAVADIRWIARFGKWFLAVLGASMVLIAGMSVTLLSHVMALNTRISVLEQRLIESEKDRAALRMTDDKILEKLDHLRNKQLQ